LSFLPAGAVIGFDVRGAERHDLRVLHRRLTVTAAGELQKTARLALGTIDDLPAGFSCSSSCPSSSMI